MKLKRTFVMNPVTMKNVRFVLLSTVLLGCSCNPFFWAQQSPECREFYKLHPQQRHTKFRTFSLDKQIDIYLCGMKREPPDTGLADVIAERGEKIIPDLVERLKAEKEGYAQDNIIHIFELMSEKGYLHGRRDVIALIREVIAGMKNKLRKEVSQERLEKIEKHSL